MSVSAVARYSIKIEPNHPRHPWFFQRTCIVDIEYEHLTDFLFFLHAVIAELGFGLVRMQNQLVSRGFGGYVHKTTSFTQTLNIEMRQ